MPQDKDEDDYILLETWQALELFSRLISRIENKPISLYFENNIFKARLKYYANENISKSIFNDITASFSLPDERSLYTANYLYLIANNLYLSREIIIPSGVLDILLEYINKNAVSELVFHNLTELKTWQPTYKKPLERTKWWLFFKDRREEIQAGIQKNTEGITKTFLSFESFGKVEIIHYSVKYEQIEVYTGSFKTHPDNINFLLLELKLQTSQYKDLRIMLWIGTKNLYNSTILLGQFQNIGDSVYSGTVMLTRIMSQSEFSQGLPQVRFYSDEDQEQKKLPEEVIKYFEDRLKNVMRSPSDIISAEDFKRWHPSTRPIQKRSFPIKRRRD